MIYKLLFVICFIIQRIQGQSPTVTLQVYYETYNFDSRLFIATELKDVVNLFAPEYVAVEMYAYGNAKRTLVDDKYEFTCENGPEECTGNIFDACAVETLDIKSAVDFINCVIDPSNGLNGEYISTTYRLCWYTEHINPQKIQECSESEKGAELLRRNGEATDLVNPKRLPYVLINGTEWNTDDDVSLFVAICEAIVGNGLDAPSECF